MQKRTLRRLAARLERIEAAAHQSTARADLILPACAQLADEGILGREFGLAWDEYRRRRDRLHARGEWPPDNYLVSDVESVRLRLWVTWNHPALDAPITTMLRQIDAAGTRLLTGHV